MVRRLTMSLVLAACALPLFLVAVWVPPRRVASASPPDPAPSPVGLSLLFQDGTMPPITLVGDAPRYLQEVDIVVNAPSDGDEGIDPLINDGEFSDLDWRGVRLVEEDWRPSGDGTFQRQRFYRGARWMTKSSQFELQPLGASGQKLGPPLKAHAGQEGHTAGSDDGFVRRFVVRQVARGCPAENNTTGATFSVQALVQFRDALHPDDARAIPPGTARLQLRWTEQPRVTRTVQVGHADPSAFPFGHGFRIQLSLVNPPAGGVYQPGDTVTVRTSFLDGDGHPLYPTGVLPSYNAALSGQDAAGLRYYDGFRLNPTLYYAFKHRESNLLLTISGPTNRLKIPERTIDFAAFLSNPNGAPIATVPVDGWSSTATTVPPPGLLLGGLFIDPLLWNVPASDVSTLSIPSDALPGTYVLAIKARREFGGEALNRATTLDIQVGTPAPTTFTAKVGNCNQCHTGPSQFGKILHGVTDFRACYTCHAALTTEPDGLLDLRVHYVHDRSGRFAALGGNVRNCKLCHLTPPTEPAKGLLNQ